MIDVSKFCIIASIEADLQNINTINKDIFGFKENRYYEKEAIRCFKSWRKYGGILKDIPIYCICLTKNIISNDTKIEFEKLNVIYIEKYDIVTDSFLSGFWNIPYSGVWFENNLKEEYFIKLDLDMELIKSIDINFINNFISETSVGIYDIDFGSDREKRYILFPNIKIQTNTCFIISSKKSKIYTKWWLKLLDICKHYEYTDILEEVAFDVLLDENIKLISNFQIGENYINLNNYHLLSPDALNNIYFSHEKIHEDKLKNINYLKLKTKFLNKINILKKDNNVNTK